MFCPQFDTKFGPNPMNLYRLETKSHKHRNRFHATFMGVGIQVLVREFSLVSSVLRKANNKR